jgi:DNA-binding transcriptional MerR regulator
MSNPINQLAILATEAETLTIGALAKQCNITVRALRYYEEMDLIGPQRRSNGQYRLYSTRALKRIKAIQALQDLGYTLDNIVAVLGPYSGSIKLAKAEQITVAETALQGLKHCIDEKLDRLLLLQQDVAQRLAVVEQVCHPCLDKTPNEACQEACHHRNTHLD